MSGQFDAEFEGVVSDRDDIAELQERIDAFAGTLVDNFDGQIRISFTVEPVIDE